MSGRITTAPCGHPGEVIIGNFVACSRNCGAGSKGLSDRLQDMTKLPQERLPDQPVLTPPPVRDHMPTCANPGQVYKMCGVNWCLGCGVRRP